jgi:cytochrome c biogenesis protein CcmG/thiol:disulfide interchange protein DsbE
MICRADIRAPFRSTLVVGLLMWQAGVPASASAPDQRQEAPAFSLSDSQGASVTLSHYRGKVVLLDFWATWCHGCKTEIPWYVEFQRRYKARGLTAIGVSMDDDGWTSIRPFLKNHRLNYPVVIGSRELADKYGVDNMPVTLLIDRDGKIAVSHSGMVNRAGFESEIRKLLQEKGKTGIK